MAYAQGTLVPTDKSRSEIEKWLRRAGADQVNSGWSEEKAVVAFRMPMKSSLDCRYIRIEMPLAVAGGRWNSREKIDQENRRRWRALLLYVRAKLESVESGIMAFEDAFMAHMVLPTGETVSRFMRPQIEQAYKSGKMPKALPGY
jgi:hypothetical protein